MTQTNAADEVDLPEAQLNRAIEERAVLPVAFVPLTGGSHI